VIVFDPFVKSWLVSFRPHQWAKNLLVVLPLLMAHRWSDAMAWQSALLAFFCFSLCASAVYLFNDVMDAAADRQHPRKRSRPIAQGLISAKHALSAGALMMAFALFVSVVVLPDFAVILALYAAITFMYSAWLKKLFLVDCLVLAGLYTIRIVGGSAATGIEASRWLLTFSVAVFVSLALVKRYSELQLLKLSATASPELVSRESLPGRHYSIADAGIVIGVGLLSAAMAVATLALYGRSETVSALYSSPKWIIVSAPATAVWLGWLWSRAAVGKMGDDPVWFALTDRVSQLIVLIIFSCFVAAIVA
jgi:4-hydroxybenzoate polyprenyltransferase